MRISIVKLSGFLAAVLVTAKVIAGTAFAAEPGAPSSPLALFLAENASAERGLVGRFIAGENPASPSMVRAAREIALLQADLLAAGFTGRLPALETDSAAEIAAHVLAVRAGIDKITPSSLLADQTIIFTRGEAE